MGVGEAVAADGKRKLERCGSGKRPKDDRRGARRPLVFGMIAAVLGDPSSGSGDCRVVLHCEDHIFRTCVSGAATWDTSLWEHPEDPPLQLGVAGGRVYALLSRGDLLMFDFLLSFHYCRISLRDTPPEAFRLESRLSPSMLEHGGQLFVVHCLFLPSESMPRGIRFSVHRLVRRRWVEQSSLDGLALFVDMAGSPCYERGRASGVGRTTMSISRDSFGMDGKFSHSGISLRPSRSQWRIQWRLTGQHHSGLCHSHATSDLKLQDTLHCAHFPVPAC